MAASAARLPTFWIKAALVVALLAVGDFLLFAGKGTPALGPLLLAFAAVALAGHPAVRRSPLGRLALAAAAFLALIQIEHFTPLGWPLFWIALGVAVLSPRAGALDGAWQWAQRLAKLGLMALPAPILDLLRLLKLRERRGSVKLQAVLLTLALPAIGAVVFLWLFASANPVIGDWFASLSLPQPDVDRIALWGFLGLLAWGTLRPRSLRRPIRLPDAQADLSLPGVTPASITLSLAVFNAVFALQNGLDIAFLWSGAALPEGMTFAGYAHRGAYPLIATALLAGLFVLVFLRPGSETARRPLVRRLVIAWTVQNLFLVASTALRTIDYIDAYSLTRLRIAALIWMALVATGLGLICWRLVRHKSAAWLINANVLAAGLVLAASAVIDLGAVAAHWNVRHSRDVGGRGVQLDVCYLRKLGEPALVSLAELERKPLRVDLHGRVAWARAQVMAETQNEQAEWRSWRWRSARRLARAEALTQGFPPPMRWECAMPQPTPPAAPRPAAPLTPPANP